MFWKTLRGMLPHKAPRGIAALGRLRCFDGIPYPYDHKKRMVVPSALQVCRMKSFRKSCVLGDISKLAGWTKGDLIGKLEESRKAKSQKFHDRKVKIAAARATAAADKTCEAFNKELATFGF